MNFGPNPIGWEPRFLSALLGIFPDARFEEVPQGEVSRLTEARQVVALLMEERGIEEKDVAWLAKDVWGGRGWRLYEALDINEVGAEDWRLSDATDALLSLPAEVQWPFWMMNRPGLDRAERRRVISRFGGVTRAIAVVTMWLYARDIAHGAARHGYAPNLVWDFWLPALPEDLPKPLGRKVFSQTFSIYEGQTGRAPAGRKPTKTDPVEIQYPDGAWDIAHLFNSTWGILSLFRDVAARHGFDLEAALHNQGRGRKQKSEDRKALGLLVALARRRNATIKAIGGVAGDRASKTIRDLEAEGEQLLTEHPELNIASPEREARLTRLRKVEDVDWGRTETDDQNEARKWEKIVAEALGRESGSSPYLVRYREAEIETIDPLDRTIGEANSG